MSESRFDEVHEEVVDLVRDGLSVADAAQAVGVAERTVVGWLRSGRRDEASKYAGFAAALDSAREERASTPGGRVELRERVWRQVDKGSVQAMKLYWEMIRAGEGSDETEEEPKDPLAGVDELALRRAG